MPLRILPLSFALALTFPAAAFAQRDGVYRWTDANGEEHYTNDLSTLPGDTVVTPVDGEELSVVRHAEPRRQEPEAPGTAVASVAPTREQLEYEKLKHEVARARIETERSEQALRRGDLEAERYWRGSFRRLRGSLRELQNALERERSVFSVDGLPVTGGYLALGPNCFAFPHQCAFVAHLEEAKVRIRQLEREIRILEEDLAELERRASNESVPHAWRK